MTATPPATTPPAPDTYIHGTTSEEQARLSRLNGIMNAACLHELALRPGERVLDVGSGLGQFTRMMGAATGRPALGIERSAAQIQTATRLAQEDPTHRTDFRQGDATALPLAPDEIGAFDVAHTRFVLEHVQNPAAVVREMARATRPGGRVVLADDDHDILRLWPEPPDVMNVWRAYAQTYRHVGNDPDIGRKLPALLADAGVRPVRCTWVFFGACSGHADFVPLVRNTISILRGAADLMTSTGLATRAQVDAATSALEAFAHRPDAALWHAISWAEGRMPA
jgi:SAM-dependent methyltransferase